MAHIQSEDEECVLAAIKLAGRISHNVELCRDLPGASIKSLVAAICRLAGEADSKAVRTIVLWYLSMQHFSQAQASKVAPTMLRAVGQASGRDPSSSAVQSEAIRALERLLVYALCCAQRREIVTATLLLLTLLSSFAAGRRSFPQRSYFRLL